MFELDHDLAQDIVDRAMAILPYNVNVMDNQGLILGSGEPERVNTRHEGAQLVLANGRVVEIDAQTAIHLKGVQPGFNLPLMLDQRLIGVLGITGEPEQLRTYAALVRMTAEMLVGQRNQQAEQQWRRQRCDDLLALLLSDAGSSPRLIDEAQQLGLKPHMTRVPYLFELGLEHGPGQTVEALSAWLTTRYPDSWCVSSAKSSLLWCRPASQSIENDRLLDKLDGLGWNILRLAVGGQADGLTGLRRCYRRTLRSWCDHDGQSQACADALGIHRNSLRYRMERIAELSGVDPLRLDGMLALYLGVQLLPQTDTHIP
jgi:carbohydrate diacid regulator